MLLLELSFFFFNDTATTEIYTLSLHDALPIFGHGQERHADRDGGRGDREGPDRHRYPRPSRPGHGRIDERAPRRRDRKSTRLNSSHANISYAVFCLKKKKQFKIHPILCATRLA